MRASPSRRGVGDARRPRVAAPRPGPIGQMRHPPRRNAEPPPNGVRSPSDGTQRAPRRQGTAFSGRAACAGFSSLSSLSLRVDPKVDARRFSAHRSGFFGASRKGVRRIAQGFSAHRARERPRAGRWRPRALLHRATAPASPHTRPSRRTTSSTFARELNALMRKWPSPQRPKPAPGVVTTRAWRSRWSKNPQLSNPAGVLHHT